MLRFADHWLIENLSTTMISETWQARAVRNGDSICVLKRAIPFAAEDDSRCALFRAEIGIALRVDHPNLVRASRAGTSLGLPYFVREYVDGPTLTQVRDACVSKGVPLGPGSVAYIGAELAAALAYLQEVFGASAVLQDLHPGNVAVDRTGRGRVIDLGSLRAPQGPLAIIPRACVAAYAAPEQGGGDGELHPNTPVHALGRILTELLFARRVSSGEQGLAFIRDASDAQSALGLALAPMLNPSPEGRPGVVGELFEDLVRFSRRASSSGPELLKELGRKHGGSILARGRSVVGTE